MVLQYLSWIFLWRSIKHPGVSPTIGGNNNTFIGAFADTVSGVLIEILQQLVQAQLLLHQTQFS